jgi:oligopeptide transport system ATP-binding protein
MSDNENKYLLEVNNISKFFPVYDGFIFRKKLGDIKAVNSISFGIKKGETLGLVGESGCGKTTTGRLILNLEAANSGTIQFEGKDITHPGKKESRFLKKDMQVIFQDPFGSLNPRMTARDIIGQPLIIHRMTCGKSEYIEKINHLLETVGLNPGMAGRYPHEFSCGQRQRLGIARAISLNPKFIVCDEPVSALDVSIQAQIINLLEELQAKLGLTYLFIAHDLAVVRHISNRIAVMYLGNIVEIATRSDLYNRPKHPYTRGLLSAVPIPDPEAEANREFFPIKGEVPSLLNPPAGCKFHPRCPRAINVCHEESPLLMQQGDKDHWAACHNIC